MKEILDNPVLPIVLRCIVVYLFVIIAIRIFGKKELAQLSVIDLVFILLISNSVQNAMVGPDTSLQGGLIAALSLFLLNYLFKRVMYRSKRMSDLLQGKEVLLVYKGKVHDANLRKADITYNELNAAIREHGVGDIEHVDIAMLEVDGNISIVSNDFQKQTVTSFPHKHRHRIKGRLN